MPTPIEIQLVGPGGIVRKTLTGKAREIMRGFDGEEFEALHVISVLRKSEAEWIKKRSDSAIQGAVRHEIRSLIENGKLEVVSQPVTGGGRKGAGIYKEVPDAGL